MVYLCCFVNRRDGPTGPSPPEPAFNHMISHHDAWPLLASLSQPFIPISSHSPRYAVVQGATLHVAGDSIAAAQKEAARLSQEMGHQLLVPHDDPLVIAGE